MGAAPTAQAGTRHPRPTLQVGYAAPRDAVERELAEIWQDLMGIERVGISDNFFELGGHSLLATQLISRIRRAFKIEVPLVKLFETPTISTLAVVLREESAGTAPVGTDTRAITEGGASPPAGTPASRAGGDDDDDVETLLREIEGLSGAEVEAALAREEGRDAES